MTKQKYEALLQQIQNYGQHDLEQRLTHSQQDEAYEQMLSLQTASERVLNLLAPRQPLSTRLSLALQIMLKRSQLYQSYTSRELALSQSGLTSIQQQAHALELWQEREDQLVLLPQMPDLSLDEQERVLQELMRQAVEVYVNQSLEQMKLHFHFEAA